MALREAIEKRTQEISSIIQERSQINDPNLEKLQKLQASIDKVVSLSPLEIVMRDNVRSHIDEDSAEFIMLCESIKTFGLMENIVAELKISDNNQFELVCVSGHRRLTALRKIGFSGKVPCLIKSYSESERVGAALSENINRKDLSFIEIAEGYQKLQEKGWSIEQLVKHFEKNKRTISRYIRIAELPEDIKITFLQNPSIFTVRTIINDLLNKYDSHAEIRKAVQRKLAKKSPDLISERSKQILTKLKRFFEERKVSSKDEQLVLDALAFAGVLRCTRAPKSE